MLGKVGAPVQPGVCHGGCIRSVEIECAAIEVGDRHEVDVDRGDYAESCLAATQPPEQFGMLLRGVLTVMGASQPQ